MSKGSVLTIYRNEDQALVRPYELHIPAHVDTLAELCSFVTQHIPPKHELEIMETGQVRQGEAQYGNGSLQETNTKTIKGYRFLYSVTGKPLWRVKECLDAKAIIVSIGPGYLPRTCSSIQTQLKCAYDNTQKRSKTNKYNEREFIRDIEKDNSEQDVNSDDANEYEEEEEEQEGRDVLTRPFHDTPPHATGAAPHTNEHSYRNSQSTCNDFTNSSHVSSLSTLKESPTATTISSHVDSSVSSVEHTRNTSQTHSQSHHTFNREPSREHCNKTLNTKSNNNKENNEYSALAAPFQYETEAWQNASPSSDNTDLANIRVSINLTTPTLYPPSADHHENDDGKVADDDDEEGRAVSINVYHDIQDVFNSNNSNSQHKHCNIYNSFYNTTTINNNNNRTDNGSSTAQDDEAQIRRFLFTDKSHNHNTGLQVTPPSRIQSDKEITEEEQNGDADTIKPFMSSYYNTKDNNNNDKHASQENVNIRRKTVISPALNSLDTEAVNSLHHTSTFAHKEKNFEECEEKKEYKFTSFVEMDGKQYGVPVAPMFASRRVNREVTKPSNEFGSVNYTHDDLDAGELDELTRLSLLLMRKWGAFAQVYKRVNVKAMLRAYDKSGSESEDECDSMDYNAFNKTHTNDHLVDDTQYVKKEIKSNIFFGLKTIRRKYASFMKEYWTQKHQANSTSSSSSSSEYELESEEKSNRQEAGHTKQSTLQSSERTLRIIVEGPAFSGVSTTAALLSIYLLQNFKHGVFLHNTLLLPIDFKMLITHCNNKFTERNYFESKEEEEVYKQQQQQQQRQQQEYNRLSQSYLANERDTYMVFTNKTVTTMLHSILHLTFDAIAVQRPRLRREIWTLCEVWLSVFDAYRSTCKINNKRDYHSRESKMFVNKNVFASKEDNETMNKNVCNKVNGSEWKAKLHQFPSLSFCNYPQAIVLVGRSVLTQWDTFAQAAFPLLLVAVHHLNEKEEIYNRQHVEQKKSSNRRKNWEDKKEEEEQEEEKKHFRSTHMPSLVENDKVRELYSHVVELIYCTLPLTIASSLEFSNVLFIMDHVHELLPDAIDTKSNELQQQQKSWDYHKQIYKSQRETKNHMKDVNRTLRISHSWSVQCAKALLQRLWSHASVHLLIAWPHHLPFNETLLLPSPTCVVKTIGLLTEEQIEKQTLTTPSNTSCTNVSEKENKPMKHVHAVNPLDQITLPRFICARNTFFSIDVFLGAPGYLSLLVEFLEKAKMHNINLVKRIKQEEKQQWRLHKQNNYHTAKHLNGKMSKYSTYSFAASNTDQVAASLRDSGNNESVWQNLLRSSSCLHDDMCQSGYVLQADYADLYSAFTELQKILTKSSVTAI